jgi:hypothetical protein
MQSPADVTPHVLSGFAIQLTAADFSGPTNSEISVLQLIRVPCQSSLALLH